MSSSRAVAARDTDCSQYHWLQLKWHTSWDHGIIQKRDDLSHPMYKPASLQWPSPAHAAQQHLEGIVVPTLGVPRLPAYEAIHGPPGVQELG